jgi:hypothetical protein
MAGNAGSFVPTTQVWDVGDIYKLNVTDKEFKELIVRMYQNINTIALALNTKDTGYYPLFEMVNSQLWFPDPTATSATTPQPNYRQVVRKVINFGILPNTGTTSVVHGITFTAASRATRIYGIAIDPVALSYLPLPYASPTAANNIELNCDGTNVNVITGSNRTAYTVCYVIIEYIKY